jgi:hypothetical protein
LHLALETAQSIFQALTILHPYFRQSKTPPNRPSWTCTRLVMPILCRKVKKLRNRRLPASGYRLPAVMLRNASVTWTVLSFFRVIRELKETVQ